MKFSVLGYCNKGHERTPENTYIVPGNRVRCRQCDKERHREHKSRERASLQQRVTVPGMALFAKLPVL